MNYSVHTPDINLNFLEVNKLNIFSNKKAPIIALLSYKDIEAVALLSRKYFPFSREFGIDVLKRRIAELYFKGEVLLPNVAPLISRSESGDIDGFLGVIFKSFQFKNKTISVANCHHLVATEEARKRMVPIKLLKAFLSGPHDVFYSDGSSDSTRQLWKRMGGETVNGESIYYKVPLRPITFLTHHLLKKSQSRLSKGFRLFAYFTDSIAGKIRFPFFYRKKDKTKLISLNIEIMMNLLKKVKPFFEVFPDYNLTDIRSLFKILDGETRFGNLQKIALFDANDKPFGWFIYFAQKGGICEVIQAVCIPGKETQLFNTLAWHAYSLGGAELSGRLMSCQLQTPFTTKTLSIPGRMWTLMKCDDVELKHSIQSGKAFITRLEGDLWVL